MSKRDRDAVKLRLISLGRRPIEGRIVTTAEVLPKEHGI